MARKFRKEDARAQRFAKALRSKMTGAETLL
jgi:hypothetical protein